MDFGPASVKKKLDGVKKSGRRRFLLKREFLRSPLLVFPEFVAKKGTAKKGTEELSVANE